jgi:Rrf2 family protein
MKLSTKGRYGARAVLELAVRYGSGPVMVKEIAVNQGISERYLEHILNTLRTAGLVKSTRGAKGGYELSKPPSKITLGVIVRALEGPMDIAPCVDEGECSRSSECVMYGIWKKVKESIDSVLDAITLEDMVMKNREIQAQAHRNI